MSYADFLARKRRVWTGEGIEPAALPDKLFDWQQAVVRWALRKGRAAIGIRESDTLNAAVARENDDERHICPLQLGTIERCVRLWSNPGELVLSPFAGIGSEGYESVRLGRRYYGIELKPAYATVAARNLAQAEALLEQGNLFSSASDLA